MKKDQNTKKKLLFYLHGSNTGKFIGEIRLKKRIDSRQKDEPILRCEDIEHQEDLNIRIKNTAIVNTNIIYCQI